MIKENRIINHNLKKEDKVLFQTWVNILLTIIVSLAFGILVGIFSKIIYGVVTYILSFLLMGNSLYKLTLYSSHITFYYPLRFYKRRFYEKTKNIERASYKEHSAGRDVIKTLVIFFKNGEKKVVNLSGVAEDYIPTPEARIKLFNILLKLGVRLKINTFNKEILKYFEEDDRVILINHWQGKF